MKHMKKVHIVAVTQTSTVKVSHVTHLTLKLWAKKEYDAWVKEAQSKKQLDQDTFDKQLLPITENKELTFSGTHMAFVDPAADPEYIFYAYKRFNYAPKDHNFYDDKKRCLKRTE